ncbi:hypothetical protein CF326_g6588 [Tilletia indica]|nr:hypothetical protein CF326_g6588 [Tilletia indica]
MNVRHRITCADVCHYLRPASRDRLPVWRRRQVPPIPHALMPGRLDLKVGSTSRPAESQVPDATGSRSTEGKNAKFGERGTSAACKLPQAKLRHCAAPNFQRTPDVSARSKADRASHGQIHDDVDARSLQKPTEGL